MNPSFASYKKVKNSLLVHWLVSTRGLEVLEQLMVVTFSSNDKNFIIETLKKGIECNGSQYYYLGQSSSQLRHSTCYVMNASLTDLHGLLEKFENFNDIFPVAKRSQKIALPFHFSFTVSTLAAVSLADNQYRNEFTSKQPVTTTICMTCRPKLPRKQCL